MSIDVAERFANDVQHPGALREALTRHSGGDPETALAHLLSVAAAHGYGFSAEDYYNSARSRAVALGLRWPPRATGSMPGYTEYQFPYSSYPPVPPPMPT